MKKISWFIIILVLIILIIILRFFIGGGEDSWIKDSRGVYVKHGNPSENPDYVLEQQQLIEKAKQLFLKYNGDLSNGPCLGTIDDYVIDIAHNPRQEVDNLAENQCEAYRNGSAKNFIELDEQGEIIRISS